MPKKQLLLSYQEASEATGIPVRRLRRLVEQRKIRVIKTHENTAMFYLEHLQEDIEDMEVAKIA